MTVSCCYFQDPTSLIHHETAMDLNGAECEPAVDYNKRPNVFRLRLASGGEYLFMAKDQVTIVNVLIMWHDLAHMIN